jgi:hypothetical protein
MNWKKNWRRSREKEFEYLISLETVKKKIKKWLVREDSYYRKNTVRKKSSYQLKERKGERLERKKFEYLISQEEIRKKFKLWLIREGNYYQMQNRKEQIYYQMPENHRSRERNGTRIGKKEFEYLISQEVVRKKFKLWLIREESYYRMKDSQDQSCYQIPESLQVYRNTYPNDQENQKERKKKEKELYQLTHKLKVLRPKGVSKFEEEEKENRNNLIEKNIIESHYSCLEKSSLVHIQNLNTGPKSSSGFQRVFKNSSKAYRGLSGYETRIEVLGRIELNEEVLKVVEERKQSTKLQYAESYVNGENSLELIQLKPRVNNPSGAQQIGAEKEFEAEEKRLYLLREATNEGKRIVVDAVIQENLYQRIKRKVVELWKNVKNFVWKRKPSKFPPDPEAEGKISGIVLS